MPNSRLNERAGCRYTKLLGKRQSRRKRTRLGKNSRVSDDAEKSRKNMFRHPITMVTVDDGFQPLPILRMAICILTVRIHQHINVEKHHGGHPSDQKEMR